MHAEGIKTFAWTPGPLVEAATAELPAGEHATQAYLRDKGIIALGNDKKLRAKALYAGKDFYKLFSFDLLHGSPENVLADEQGLVLSHDLATRLFGNAEAALGQTVSWNLEGRIARYRVSGIQAAIPSRSTLQFDVVLPYARLVQEVPNFGSWDSNEPFTYLRVSPETDVKELSQQIQNYWQANPILQIPAYRLLLLQTTIYTGSTKTALP